MLPKKIFTFLTKISNNNNRDWFMAHKEEYLDIKKILEKFSEQLLPGLQLFDETLREAEMKGYIFRIYRDARFAKGKPYKEHFGLLFLRGGKPDFHSFGGYYLNIQPGNNFIVAGAYCPDKKWLADIRESIANDATDIRKILKTSGFDLQGSTLKTAPRGFSKDHKNIDLLRYKDLYVIHHFTDRQVFQKNFAEQVAQVCKKMYPINKWLNSFVG